MVDLDEDGDHDVLGTNGDMFDDDILKPYHGVQWLENKGGLRFEARPLARLAGAHRAAAGDLDGDGDLDIVASAFTGVVAGKAAEALPALVWLEQVKPGRFARHTIAAGPPLQSTLDLGDVDGDGDRWRSRSAATGRARAGRRSRSWWRRVRWPGREVVRADTRVTLAPGGAPVTVDARRWARARPLAGARDRPRPVDRRGGLRACIRSTCPGRIRSRSRPRPAHRRRAPRSSASPPRGTLRCAFEVFGSSGAVSAGHVVWRDGATVRETRATLVEPAGGSLRREIATDLAGLAPGDYLLELRVHDQTTGRDLNVREPFTIAANGSLPWIAARIPSLLK